MVAARGASTRETGPDDTVLADWIRHYAVVVIVLTMLGGAAGLAWGALTTPRAEMWSIVVDTEQLLPSRQLGVVAETLFRAEETYGPALTELDLPYTPDELFDTVELRSVPESRLLIVVARADDTYTASIVSAAMARSLSEAFQESGYGGFEILGAPQPATVSSAVSLPVFAGLGAVVGLLVALGLAVLHYRARRPVLSLGVAAALLGPSDVVTVPQRWRVLGALRPLLPPSLSASATSLAIGQLHPAEAAAALRWPGAAPRRVARLSAILGLDDDPEAERTVVVADPRSRTRDLEETLGGNASTQTLLWLA